MNLDKAKKRIAKLIKKGDCGYPKISITYFGQSADTATDVVITFLLEEGAQPQEQKLSADNDVRKDETIQSTLVKIIERAAVSTVTEDSSVTIVG